MRASDDIETAMEQHGSTVWRVCLGFFRSQQDSEDAYQDTFVKYALADDVSFADDNHRKAWLIRVASNVCKDMLRASARNHSSLEESDVAETLVSMDSSSQPNSRHLEVLEAFRSLDDPPRFPLYLAICEGYSAPEIAEMLDAPVNTVYSWISRGRTLLKEALS